MYFSMDCFGGKRLGWRKKRGGLSNLYLSGTKISMWQKSVALTAGCLQAKQQDIKIPQMKDGLNFSIRRVNRGAERKNIFLLGQG